MAAALEGIRVLEMGSYTTGPMAGKFLANLGAEVIKLEPPKGDAVRLGFAYKIAGSSYIFHTHNCNKKGIVVDTAQEQGKKIVLDLVPKIDILIENFAYGTMDKWGFSYEELKKVNPGLIYCSTCGFGHTGPRKALRAFDTVLQGMSGVMSLTGHRDGPPIKIGMSAADAMGGTVSAMAVLAALWHKRRTGRGQHVNISMQDIMGWVTAESWPLHYSGKELMRDGNRHLVLAPQNLFEAQDGLVAMAVENEKQWNNLCRLIGFAEGEDSFSYAGMKEREQEMEERIAAWVKGKTRDEVVAVCQEMKIPAGPVLEIGEVAEHPHTWARQMIVELERGDGEKIKLLGSPFHMSLTPSIMESTAPLLGEHTGEILRDVLGYPVEEIRRLQEEGVILMADG